MRRFSLVCLILLSVVLVGPLAGGCGGRNFDAISRILADPLSFESKDVSVKGRVTNVFDPTSGLLGLSAYQVDDGTGKIWIISRTGAPSRGQQVDLKARVRRDFKLGNDVFGAVLNEIERNRR